MTLWPNFFDFLFDFSPFIFPFPICCVAWNEVHSKHSFMANSMPECVMKMHTGFYILHLFSRSGNHILNIFKGFSGEKWLHPFLMTKPNVLLCSPQFMHILAMRTVKLVAPKCARVTDTRWFNVKYNFFSTSYTVFKFQVPLQYFWRNQASCSGEILCGNKWRWMT